MCYANIYQDIPLLHVPVWVGAMSGCHVCMHVYIPMSTAMCVCLCPSACAPPRAHVHVDLCMDAPVYSTTARTCMCTLVCAFSCPCLMQISVTYVPTPSPSSWEPPIMALLAPLPVLILAANLVLFYSFLFLLSALPRWSSSFSFGGNDKHSPLLWSFYL